MPPRKINRRDIQKRKQFSSCDACRRSRVACDASKFGHEPTTRRSNRSCSRCSAKNQRCTFDWIKNGSKNAEAARRESPPQASRLESEPYDAVETMDSGNSEMLSPNALLSSHDQHGAIDGPFEQRCYRLFEQGLNNVVGFAMGLNGCPFINDQDCSAGILTIDMFRTLDNYLEHEVRSHSPDDVSVAHQLCQKRNDQIDASLHCAVRAFTARWIPLTQKDTDQDVETIHVETWRTARKAVLKVINRISYRSVLALYLFAQTPVPSNISDEEELDGISGTICLQTALLHVQRLRKRQRVVSPQNTENSASTPESTFSSAFLNLESRAYWAAVIWDTTSSLQSNLRTSLTSGLNGACSEPAWRLTRTFLLRDFHPRMETGQNDTFEVSDEAALRVISVASVAVVYVWKTITSVKEALIEGVDEDVVQFVWRTHQEALQIFASKFRPLLDSYEKRLQFLDQTNRFCWYRVKLQYYLGILSLAATLQTANRADLLGDVKDILNEAEHGSFNILGFGTSNPFSFSGEDDDRYHISTAETAEVLEQDQITMSLIAIDTSLSQVVDCVDLMAKVISRKYREGKLKASTCHNLLSTLDQALAHLPKTAKIVKGAKGKLQQLWVGIGLTISPRDAP